MSVCSVDGCEKKADARGVCNTHYMQLRRAKLVPIGTRAPATVEERFWRYVDQSSGECWLWTGAKQWAGYCLIGAGGAGAPMWLAHRLSYTIHHGPIPEGLMVLHGCDNPSCVNPAHLTAGTHAENIKQAYDRGLLVSPFKKGAAHHAAVLTEENVREIRSSPLKSAQLARAFGCSTSTISALRRGETWQHVT
jgi:hypothetical protein